MKKQEIFVILESMTIEEKLALLSESDKEFLRKLLSSGQPLSTGILPEIKPTQLCR